MPYPFLPHRLRDLHDATARQALFHDLATSGRGVDPDELPAFLAAVDAELEARAAELLDHEQRRKNALAALATFGAPDFELTAAVENAIDILEN